MTTLANIASMRAPVDCPDLARSFVELERKLADWTDAVRGAHRRFAEHARGRSLVTTLDESVAGADEAVDRPAAVAKIARAAPPRELTQPAAPQRDAVAEEHRVRREELHEDFETILATLGPGLANAVRVRHRLFNGRRPVDQLIDECIVELQVPKPKSWWEKRRA